MINSTGSVCRCNTGDLHLNLYLKASSQMEEPQHEQHLLKQRTPTGSLNTTPMFFTSDPLLDVQENLQPWCFLTVLLRFRAWDVSWPPPVLLRLWISFIVSSCLHIIFRVKVRPRCMDPFLPHPVCSGFNFGCDCCCGGQQPVRQAGGHRVALSRRVSQQIRGRRRREVTNLPTDQTHTHKQFSIGRRVQASHTETGFKHNHWRRTKQITVLLKFN